MPTEQEQQEQQQHSAGDVESAGTLLRRTREDRGLDEKQVADQLRITVHYVKAIEADKYDKLPGAIFARGYLKSYAGLLSLDPADIVARYEAATGSKPQQTRKQPESPQTANGGNTGMRWALASVAAFVVLFVGIWVISGPTVESTGVAGNSPETGSGRSVDTSNNQTRSNPLTAVERSVANEPTLPVPEPPADRAVTGRPLTPATEPETELDTQPDPDSTAPESAVTSARDQDSVAENAPVALADTESPAAGDAAQPASEPALEAPSVTSASPDAIVETAAEGANASPGEAPDQEPAGASSADSGQAEEQVAINVLQSDNGERIIEVDAAGPDMLQIRFSGESWVEVNDADQRLIYRDLRESGDVLEVSGRAPFNILLGDAPLTSLRLNGTTIDVSDEIRIDNSARLTVGL